MTKSQRVAKAMRTTTTVSETARALIKCGLTNQEVQEKLNKRFNLGEGKQHYAAWYRAAMKRAAAA